MDNKKLQGAILDRMDNDKLQGAILDRMDNDKLLRIAARLGKLDEITLLLDKGAQVDQTDERGDTALTNAARYAEIPAMKLLLERGAELDRRNTHGKTALMVACESGKHFPENCKSFLDYNTAILFLIEMGASVNIVTPEGDTPLTLALSRYRWHIANKLLQYGLDPTLSKRHQLWLHRAIINTEYDLMRELVVHGFPPLDVSLEGFGGPYENYPDMDEDKVNEWRTKVECYLNTRPVSPLAVSLLYNKVDVARYLILNQFFTRFDIVQLWEDHELRQILQDIEAEEALYIVDFLKARPQSLNTLSLIAVCSALSQDFVCNVGNTSRKISACNYEVSNHSEVEENTRDDNFREKDMYSWSFKPTFRERVECLGLPPPLRRLLLHQTPSSSICCKSWGDISLGKKESISAGQWAH